MKDAATFWDGIAGKYAATPISDMDGYEYTLERTRSYLKETDRVLEIGAGTGRTALALVDNVKEMVVTDISEAMLDVGRGEAWDKCIDNISFEVCDASDLPDGPFDAVLAHNVLHLVPELPATLRAAHAALKPGGLLITKTFVTGNGTFNAFATFMRIVLPIMQFIGKAPFVAMHKLKDFERAFGDAGFEIIETGSYPAKGQRQYIVARKR